MEALAELELFILRTLKKNPNKLPTHADFAAMMQKAGDDEALLAKALGSLAVQGLLRKSGVERGAGGSIQFSLSAMWLTPAGENAIKA